MIKTKNSYCLQTHKVLATDSGKEELYYLSLSIMKSLFFRYLGYSNVEFPQIDTHVVLYITWVFI